jgi:hypothetical protein
MVGRALVRVAVRTLLGLVGGELHAGHAGILRHILVGRVRELSGAVVTLFVQGDGASGIRTRDLLAASQTLSQLSYGPAATHDSPRRRGARPFLRARRRVAAG